MKKRNKKPSKSTNLRKRGLSRVNAGQIKSLRELARLVDRSAPAVLKWLRNNETWPFNRQPPWDRSILPTVLEWMKTIGPNNAHYSGPSMTVEELLEQVENFDTDKFLREHGM